MALKSPEAGLFFGSSSCLTNSCKLQTLRHEISSSGRLLHQALLVESVGRVFNVRGSRLQSPCSWLLSTLPSGRLLVMGKKSSRKERGVLIPHFHASSFEDVRVLETKRATLRSGVPPKRDQLLISSRKGKDLKVSEEEPTHPSPTPQRGLFRWRAMSLTCTHVFATEQ